MKHNWVKYHLNALCNPKQWPTISARDLLNEGYPVYGANGLIGYYSDYNHEDETILITCRGATCGTINISAPRSYITGNAMCLDGLDKRKCDIRFIYYALIRRGLNDVITGSAQPQITRQSLDNVTISLPPLEQQKRIAAILDKADAIRCKRQQAIKLADDFLRATFLDMFGDPVTNPKGWEVKPLSKLCDVRDGTHDSPKYVANGYPLVTSKNLKNGFIDFSDVNLITEEDFIKINKRSAVDYGDIIMPMIGTIGNPVLVETHDKFAIKNVALIKFKDADINNHYVLHLLKSHYFEWAIKDINRGGTQQFIALTDIRNLPIPVPSKAMMNEFDQFIDKFQSLGNRHDLMKVDSSKLFNSLTQRAFRGEV